MELANTPMIWQDHLRKTPLDTKFKESVTHPGVFQHETRNILLCVHVDDSLCTGFRDNLMWLKKQLRNEYELDTMLMGEDDDMENKAVYRNGVSTVLGYCRIEGTCVHSCVSWAWRTVEVSPRHCVPQWRRKEIGVTDRR